MTRMVAADRREDIIEAATRVLLRKGVSAATTRDVTAEIGVGVGLLSHYFGWADLRAAAFERIVRSDLERSLIGRAHEPATAVMTDLLTQAFETQFDPIWRVWIEASDLATTDAALATCVHDCSHLWQTSLRDLWARGASDGMWTCADPDGASWRLMAIIYGLAGLALVPNAMLSRDGASAHLSVMVRNECDWTMRRKPGLNPKDRTLKGLVRR